MAEDMNEAAPEAPASEDAPVAEQVASDPVAATADAPTPDTVPAPAAAPEVEAVAEVEAAPQVSADSLDEIFAKLARGAALEPDEQLALDAYEAEQAALARGDA